LHQRPRKRHQEYPFTAHERSPTFFDPAGRSVVRNPQAAGSIHMSIGLSRGLIVNFLYFLSWTVADAPRQLSLICSYCVFNGLLTFDEETRSGTLPDGDFLVRVPFSARMRSPPALQKTSQPPPQ
jgi:hypothetical protein